MRRYAANFWGGPGALRGTVFGHQGFW